MKFDPEEKDAAGKAVRSFVIRQAGVKEQALDIRATLWPSHDHVALEKGDAVLVEGKFNVNKAKNREGEPTTYFNLSVSNIINLGPGDRGEREETTNTDAEEVAEDDIPY